MNMRAEGSSVQFSIAAVERDTGLGKDTLRVWERRYGFPKPTRDAYDERTYPLDQVEKLRVIKRLLNAGLRPGKIVPLELSELLALSAQQNTPSQNIQTHDAHQNLLNYMDLLRQHAPEDLRNSLSQALVHMGLAAFINQVVAPLTQMVGESWMRGELAVFEEHLFTECITGVLRGAGDTRTPMWATLAGHWLAGMPLGWMLCFRRGMGAAGMWLGLAAGLGGVATMLLFAWRRRIATA